MGNTCYYINIMLCSFFTILLVLIQLNENLACEDIKPAKWCTKNLERCDKEGVKTKCEKSCGFCKECKDIKPTKWCTKNLERCDQVGVKTKCEKSCGVCKESGSSIRLLEKKIKDLEKYNIAL